MGFSHEAYVAYGVHVPVNPYRYDETGRWPGEQVDQVLSVPTVREACPDIGYLEAGEYDRDMFFIVTKCDRASLGSYTRIGHDENGRSVGHLEVSWDRQIMHLIEVMGWSGLADTFEPGWFVVTDMS